MEFRALCIQSARPTYWFSLLGFGIAYLIWPQGFAATGISFARPTDGALKRVGLMKLFGNGWPLLGSIRLTGLPLDWQAADSKVLKSPPVAAAVGTKLSVCGGAVRVRVAWKPENRNSLSLRIGPPTVPPNWF